MEIIFKQIFLTAFLAILWFIVIFNALRLSRKAKKAGLKQTAIGDKETKERLPKRLAIGRAVKAIEFPLWSLFVIIFFVCPACLTQFSFSNLFGSFIAMTELLGLTFMIFFVFWYVWLLSIMKDSWRAGTAPGEKRELVTKGPFKYVRHPIYALWPLIYLGSFLLAPNFFFLLSIILGIIGGYGEAKAEEFFLLKQFEEYREYMKRTGMFLPKLTKNKEQI